MPLGAAHFDPSTGAWVLSRYADVLSALHEPKLVVTGTTTEQHVAHVAVREALAQALSPDRLARWRSTFENKARALVDALPAGQPVDLVWSLAQPWSLTVAVEVTGAASSKAAECAHLARQIFLEAAQATNGIPSAGAQQAAAALAAWLGRGHGADNPVANVQTFVALSQTLPSLLASAWLALLGNAHGAAALARLRGQPTLIPSAVGELLRIASPSRAVFREAVADVEIAGTRLQAGDRVTLMLCDANRDVQRFAVPDALDLHRAHAGHLAFGSGPHACAGAALVRMAVAVATEALLCRTVTLELISPAADIEWIGGFAIRAPAAIPVQLTRTTDSESAS